VGASTRRRARRSREQPGGPVWPPGPAGRARLSRPAVGRFRDRIGAVRKTHHHAVQGYQEFDISSWTSSWSAFLGLTSCPPALPDERKRSRSRNIQTVLDVVQTGLRLRCRRHPAVLRRAHPGRPRLADHVLLARSRHPASSISRRSSGRWPHGYPEDKLYIVNGPTPKWPGHREVERHLGRRVKVTLSSSIDVPRPSTPERFLILSKPRARWAHELNGLVQMFAPATDQRGQPAPAGGADRRRRLFGR